MRFKGDTHDLKINQGAQLMSTVSYPSMMLRMVLLGACLLFIGCQMARMAVPQDLEAQSEPYTCKGRTGFTLTERFEFGPYKVTEVRRGWTRRFTASAASWEHTRARQQYEYVMTTPNGARWQGLAATGVKKNDIRATSGNAELILGITSDINFVTHLGIEKDAAPWTLAMAQGAGDHLLKGILTDGKAQYLVAGTHRLQGSSMPLPDTAGYLISKDGKPVAAVDLLNEGSVRLSRSLTSDEKDLLSAAAATLMLYQDVAKN
jgi:hypothetical protein